MKCFKCNGRCVTEYLEDENFKIYAVRKACVECDWTSHITMIPEKIQ
jgi:hypothetical protein